MKSIAFEILNQGLWMSCMTAKFIAWVLTKVQKDYQLEVTQDNLESIRNNPDIFKKLISGNES